MENQNHHLNEENLNDQIKNTDDFDKIKELYETKRNNII